MASWWICFGFYVDLMFQGHHRGLIAQLKDKQPLTSSSTLYGTLGQHGSYGFEEDEYGSMHWKYAPIMYEFFSQVESIKSWNSLTWLRH